MKVYELKCKNCGADLKVSDDRKVIFCEYCGSKNFVDDEVMRSEVYYTGTVNYRDEARLRELELKEEERIREETKQKKVFWRWHTAVIVFAVLSFVLGPISTVFGGETALFYSVVSMIIGCFVIPVFYPYDYCENDNIWLYIMAFFECLFVYIVCFFGGLFALAGGAVFLNR